MADELERVYGPAAPDTSPEVLATVGPGKRWILTQALLANDSSSPSRVSVAIGAIGAVIVPNVLIAAFTVETLELSQGMVAGEELLGVQENAGAVVVTISAFEKDA